MKLPDYNMKTIFERKVLRLVSLDTSPSILVKSNAYSKTLILRELKARFIIFAKIFTLRFCQREMSLPTHYSPGGGVLKQLNKRCGKVQSQTCKRQLQTCYEPC